jgi:general secretion pathway protein J
MSVKSTQTAPQVLRFKPFSPGEKVPAGRMRAALVAGSHSSTSGSSQPSPQPSPRGRGSSVGFTLVEVIIAFALLAMLAGMMFAGFRFALGASEKGAVRNEMHEDMRRAQDFLRQHLEEMLPLRYQKELGQPLRFKGDAEKIVYIAPVISRVAEGGIQWWELAARGSGAERILALRRIAYTGDESATPEFNEKEESTLAQNIVSVKFSYFDQPDPLLSGNWTDNWTDEQRLPNLIRVQVIGAQGRAWPEFVVAPQLSPRIGCPNGWNERERRCVSRQRPPGT